MERAPCSRALFGLRRWTARRARIIVLGLVVLGVALRLWVVVAVPPLGLTGDEHRYWNRAAAVLSSGDPGTAVQPPAMAYALAVVRWWRPDGVLVARGLNVAWFALGAGALLALARTYPRAVVPMGIYALHPVLIGFAGYLWSEPLFLAFFLAAYALALRSSLASAVAAGAMFAVAGLTRQIGLSLFVILLAYRLYESWPRRKPLLRLALMATTFALVLVPWLARNWVVLGEPVFTTNSGFALWVGNQRDVGEPYAWQYRRIGGYETYYLRFASDELGRDREAARRARAFIASEMPAWIVKKGTIGLAHLYEPDNFILRRMRKGEYGGAALPWLRRVGVLTLAGEVVVLVWGAYVMLGLRDRRAATMLGAISCWTVAIHVLTVGHSRHRLVLGLMPLLVTGVRRTPFSGGRLAAALVLVATLLGFGVASEGRQQLMRTFAGDGRVEARPPALPLGR